MDSKKIGSSQSRWLWIPLALVGLNIFAVSQITFANEPPATVIPADEVATLAEQLGSPSFAMREVASKRLLEIGEPALEALRKLESHTSLEVRERAGLVGNEIDKVVFNSVTKKFLLDADSTQSYGLPAWKQFREIAGDSRTSKLLFVMMLRQQRELATYVDAAGKANDGTSAALSVEQLEARTASEAERLLEKTFQGHVPDVGDTAGLLLACTMLKGNAPLEVNKTIIMSLYRGPLAEYFAKPGYSRCMRALAGRWIPKTQETLADDVISIALQRGIPEGVIVARRHLNSLSDQETRGRAFQCLARFGDHSDIPYVASFLNDESVICEFMERSEVGFAQGDIQIEDRAPPGRKQLPILPNGRAMIVRVNDLALAVCMLLGSEDVASVFPKYQPDETNGIRFMDVAFATDDQEYHKLAISRWQRDHARATRKPTRACILHATKSKLDKLS